MNIKLSDVRNQMSEVRCQKPKVRFSVFCLLSSVFCFVAGCENAGSRATLAKEIKILREEKTQLRSRTEQSETENKQLKKQVKALAGVSDKARLENLYRLQRIKITKYTNLYDRDKDGKKEKLIVYLQPMDKEGDIIKAIGDVDVQLWDLNRKDGEALLAQWHVDADELKKNWFATFLTINYRLAFDVADKIEDAQEPLTVKVTFTDYLTGRVFKEQTAIKPP